jgi:hypothetical protein
MGTYYDPLPLKIRLNIDDAVRYDLARRSVPGEQKSVIETLAKEDWAKRVQPQKGTTELNTTELDEYLERMAAVSPRSL